MEKHLSQIAKVELQLRQWNPLEWNAMYRNYSDGEGMCTVTVMCVCVCLSLGIQARRIMRVFKTDSL